MSIGLLGNLAATTPLAWASQAHRLGASVFGAAVAFTALCRHRRLGWWCATLRRATLFWPARRSRHARCCKACWRCCAILS